MLSIRSSFSDSSRDVAVASNFVSSQTFWIGAEVSQEQQIAPVESECNTNYKIHHSTYSRSHRPFKKRFSSIHARDLEF